MSSAIRAIALSKCWLRKTFDPMLTNGCLIGFCMSSGFGKQYTSYWPIFDHGLIDLSCKSKSKQNVSTWYWRNDSQIARIRLVSSADKKDERNTNNLDIQNRIRLKNFDGMSFPLQISPAQFEDAGNYECTMDTMHLVKIELITMQVSAIPSHPLTEGDSVSLACSISQVSNSTRLVWMDNGRNILVKEKTFNLSGEGKYSLSLFIPKIGQHNRRWTCLVFNRSMLKIHIVYRLAVNERNKNADLNYIFIPVVWVLLCLSALIMSCLRKINSTATDDRREITFRNIISNSEQNSEEIHYASVIFQQRSPDPALDEQSDLQSSVDTMRRAYLIIDLEGDFPGLNVKMVPE
ncbi:uncharacterized protein [Scyliorhinus torazame]|uniref:uncharacterized protein n=1 Tax=Scyliorhinus torazame TaxID=75743 RepID=UPI003B59DFCF